MDFSIKRTARNLIGLAVVAIIAYIVAVAVPISGLVIGASIFVGGTAAIYVSLFLAHLNQTKHWNILAFIIFLAGLTTFLLVFGTLNFAGNLMLR
ncbi:hypothetical protein [Corynebacterium sp.]|uniref:hypothetical protein n=1 Tax=Corynebacterium sp. TaxID=1720 RepID=UPI0028AD7634|nr:hypothetical protein [Corynebacterium sp.]